MRKKSILLAGATALFLSTPALADNHDPLALQAKALNDRMVMRALAMEG